MNLINIAFQLELESCNFLANETHTANLPPVLRTLVLAPSTKFQKLPYVVYISGNRGLAEKLEAEEKLRLSSSFLCTRAVANQKDERKKKTEGKKFERPRSSLC